MINLQFPKPWKVEDERSLHQKLDPGDCLCKFAIDCSHYVLTLMP
jgi:hypothetical protein